MPIIIKCAWCGTVSGSKEGDATPPFNITHTICPSCAGKMRSAISRPSGALINKRAGEDRRKGERRRSVRYVGDTLIIANGIAWIDNEGTDRRKAVRRQDDRKMILRMILDGASE